MFRGQCSEDGSGSAAEFGPPPADSDEEETPVAEEFGGLPLEGVADELEYPADDEESDGVGPEAVDKGGGDGDGD